MTDERFPDDDWRTTLDGLSGAGVPAPDPSFREALLDRTRRSVRARRTRGRLLRAAAVLLVFAGGVAVGTRLDDGRGLVDPQVAPPTIASPDGERPAAPDVPSDPSDLERRLARVEPDVRSAEWQRAGDAYLTGDITDPTAALYCYQRALDAAPEGSPSGSIDSDDSWLLRALKADRN